MKKIIPAIVVIFLFSALACNQTKVPDKVSAAFAAKYPSAQNVKWDKESATEFEAEFVMNGKKMSASFDADGNMITQETAEVGEEGEENEAAEHGEEAEEHAGHEGEISVTDAVAATFKAKYPSAQNVEWGMESATEFEAEFEMNGNKMSANFDADGNWIETEAVLTKDDLPAAVLAALNSQFGESEIMTIESLEKAGEAIVYEIKLKKGETETDIEFDSNGNVIK